MPTLSPATRGLLIANAVVFVAGLLLPDLGRRMVVWLALWFPRHEHFALWQLVTYMFMHGGIGHIFFNMFGLVSFGVMLERQWGPRRFLVFYFLCGIGAALVHLAVSWGQFQAYHLQLREAGVSVDAINRLLETGRFLATADPAIREVAGNLFRIQESPMVGASGAIYGILVAFAFLYPNAKLALLFVPVPIAAKYFIPVMVALDLFSGVTGFSLFGGGIAHFAHIGGALIGLLIVWHWRRRAPRPFVVE